MWLEVASCALVGLQLIGRAPRHFLLPLNGQKKLPKVNRTGGQPAIFQERPPSLSQNFPTLTEERIKLSRRQTSEFSPRRQLLSRIPAHIRAIGYCPGRVQQIQTRRTDTHDTDRGLENRGAGRNGFGSDGARCRHSLPPRETGSLPFLRPL